MRSLLLLFAVISSVHAQQTIRLPLGGGVDMELVRIEPGNFTQGEPVDLRREVNLSKPFYIGRFPITRGQFARFVAATNYRTESEKGASGGFGWEGGKLVQKKQYTWRTPGFSQTDEHPVVMVDFADAKAFCSWLSRQSGRAITLPTEAQWEYAARGGGNAGEAWTAANSPGGTQPVGKKTPNGFGIHDMIGNAWEWCEDWFAPYQAGPVNDPLQTNANLSDKPRRVLRGGAFSRPATDASVAKRYRNDAGSRNADNGFRVVAAVGTAGPPVPARPTARVELESPQPPKPASRPAVPGELNIPQRSGHEAPEVGHRETSSRSGGMGIFGWALSLAGVFVAWKLVKRVLGSFTANPVRAASPIPPSPVSGDGGGDGMFSIRIMDDGFWIRSRVAVGTSLNARWTGTTSTQMRTFDYRPGPEGHFVFTGSRPSGVSVSVGESSDHDTSSDNARMLGNAAGMFQQRNVDPPRRGDKFTGFPSAY